MPFKPRSEGEYPTLGWAALDWIEDMLATPDTGLGEYEPLVLTREQAEFTLKLYRLNPRTGKRIIHRAVISRPRGWGKSPFLAALACWEALGEPVFDGWDADGQPVGKTWASFRTPLVQIGSVSEDATKQSWEPLLEMLRDGPVIDEYPGLEPLDTVVNLPKGWIYPTTASYRTIRGKRAVFAVMDQTESWLPSNKGVIRAQTMRANATKLGGCTVESPNAFIPGENSVAEDSAAQWAAIKEGRARIPSLHYDHREAPADTDLDERKSLIAGLRVAYGDSSDHKAGCVIHDPPCDPGWAGIDRMADDFDDTANDRQMMRADFLNQITHATDSWLSQPEWKACLDATKVVADKDVIVLGFDGSRARKRGVADSTALVAVRLSDGHMWIHGIWEQPHGPAGKGWEVPAVEVDASVRSAFERYRVVGLYADPAYWETYIASWEAAFNNRLKVRVSANHPMSWWINQGRGRTIERALEQLKTAIVNREMTHDGDSRLTTHFLNARRRPGPSGTGLWIGKEHADSANKVDAAWAGVAAYSAYLDAKAAGVKAGTPGTGRAIALN